jgi:hypothetical protein
MAKSTKATKATKATTKVEVKAPARKRAAAYDPKARITISQGDEARRVVRNLTCDRALQAMAANPIVEKFVATFGAECDKKPLPGRGGQPGATQAAAILRFLEREGAVTVASK